MTDAITTAEAVTAVSSIHPSIVLTPLGWLFVLTINIVGFRRAELSRIKDKATSQIETLFADLTEKISERSCTENALDDLLSSKITLIELRLNQFSRKSGYELLSPDLVSEMRDKPFDWLSETGNVERKVAEFEYRVLENLENNYSNWLFEKWWKSTTRLFKENWGSVLLVVSLLSYLMLWFT